MATSKTHWIKVAEVYDYGDDLYDLVLKTVPGVSLDIAWQSMTTEQRRGVVEESIALVEIVLTLLKQSPISMTPSSTGNLRGGFRSIGQYGWWPYRKEFYNAIDKTIATYPEELAAEKAIWRAFDTFDYDFPIMKPDDDGRESHAAEHPN